MSDLKLNLSVEEAADALGIGVTLCKRYIADGSLPSIKLGNRRLIRIHDLEAFNDAQGDRPRILPARSQAASR